MCCYATVPHPDAVPVVVLVLLQNNMLVALYFGFSNIQNSSEAHVRKDSISAMTGCRSHDKAAFVRLQHC